MCYNSSTLPETNSSHLKIDPLNSLEIPVGHHHFQGRTCMLVSGSVVIFKLTLSWKHLGSANCIPSLFLHDQGGPRTTRHRCLRLATASSAGGERRPLRCLPCRCYGFGLERLGRAVCWGPKKKVLREKKNEKFHHVWRSKDVRKEERLEW